MGLERLVDHHYQITLPSQLLLDMEGVGDVLLAKFVNFIQHSIHNIF